MSDDKHGDSRSGWCLTRHCEDCERPECPHDCPHPKRANHVAAQAETGEIGYTGGASKEAAPAGASTPVGPGPRPSDRKD